MNDVPRNGFGLPLAGGASVAAAPLATAPPVTPVAPRAAARAPVAAPTPPPAAAPVPAAGGGSQQRIILDDLLIHVLDCGASDLHLTEGAAPTVRLRGEMEVIDGFAPLTSEQLRATLYGVMTERQRKVFEEELELDFAYAVPGHARFRVNVFQQRESIGAVMRIIPCGDPAAGEAGHARRDRELHAPQARPGARHRADRLRQVDDAGRDDRPDQPDRGAVTS